MEDEPDAPFLHGSAKRAIGASAAANSADRSPHDERYLFHQVARVMPFMLWVCRPDGEAMYVSPQWVAYTGVALDQHLGRGWFNFLHPEDRAPALKAWQEALTRVE